MRDERKNKAELIEELKTLRNRVSELEKTKETLQKSGEKWRSLAQTAPSFILTVSQDGTIQFVNRPTGGFIREQSIGKKVYEHVEPGQCDIIRRCIENVFQTGKPDRYEILGRGPDGKNSAWYETNVGPIIHDGKVVAVTMVCTDITERKKAEDTLRESQTLIQGILDNTSSIVVVRDIQGRYILVNREVENLLGMKSEDIIGKTPHDIHSADHANKILADDKRVIDCRRRIYIEDRLDVKGETRTFLGSKFPLLNIAGEPYAVCTLATDITERKKAEINLKESEQRFRSIFENAADGIVLADVESKKFFMANSVLCQMLDYNKQEFKTLGVEDIHPAEDLPYVLEQFDKQVRGELRLAKDIPVKRKDGSVFYADINSFPITLEGNRYLMGIFRDMTERKKTYEEINKLAMFPSQNPNPILRIAKDGMVLYANEASSYVLDTWGIQVGQILPKAYYERVKESLNSGKASLFEFNCYNGRIFLVTLAPVVDEGYLNIYGIDITDRKKVEGALRQNEERYRSVVEDSPSLLCSFLPNGEISFVNAAYCKYFDKTSEELIGSKFTSLIPEEDRQTVMNNILSLTVDSPLMTHEHKVIARDGQIRWQRWTNRAFFDNRGHPVLFQSFGEDISEHKKIDEALQKHKRWLEYLVSSSPAVIYTSKASGDYGATYISENVTSQTGYGAKDFVENSSFWIDHIHPDDKQRVLDGLSTVFDKGHHTHEYRFLYKDGSYQWMLDELRLVRDEQGNPLEIIGSWVNITDRKQAEEALGESEERFRSLLQTAPNVILFLSTDYRILEFNAEAEQIYGCKREEVLGKNYLETFLPENVRADVAEDIRKVLAGKATRDFENTIKCADGIERIFMWNVNRVLDKHGCPVGVIAAGQDITERKKSEVALAESEEKYRTLVESAGDSIVTIDENGVFLFLNRMAASDMGGKPEDFVGRKMWDLFPKEIADRQAANVRKVVDKKQGMNLILPSEIQGQSRWYNTTIEPLRDVSGKVVAVMVIARDISEAKKAEEELGKYREEMARAEELATLGTLSATVAHELTQPLTVIRLSLENALEKLQATSSLEDIIKKLKDSLTETSNINSIVERFRSFARKSTKKSIKEVELKIIAERIVDLLKENARRARVTIDFEGMDELPSFYSNEKDLEQLIFALVDNTIQAANGKEPRQLIISGAVKGEHIELRFSDNCGGIAPENLGKIFEPFFTTKSAQKCTGLGLCIVQDIVSRAGGKVYVESKFGEGSTFIVTLHINE